jgi:aminopeptidase N
MQIRLLLILLVLPVYSLMALPSSDSYPKNPNIDAVNYRFNIKVSDTTDEISCVETIDIRYLAAGETLLRLDLIKASEKKENRGMVVSKVISNGKNLAYTHENDVLTIQLSTPSTLEQRSSYTVMYKGVPDTGLKIANNKYGDRTFFSDNWPNKGRNWLATIDHPYDKATCEFIVTAPDHYQVVSNGLKVEETNLPNGFP